MTRSIVQSRPTTVPPITAEITCPDSLALLPPRYLPVKIPGWAKKFVSWLNCLCGSSRTVGSVGATTLTVVDDVEIFVVSSKPISRSISSSTLIKSLSTWLSSSTGISKSLSLTRSSADPSVSASSSSSLVQVLAPAQLPEPSCPLLGSWGLSCHFHSVPSQK